MGCIDQKYMQKEQLSRKRVVKVSLGYSRERKSQVASSRFCLLVRSPLLIPFLFSIVSFSSLSLSASLPSHRLLCCHARLVRHRYHRTWH